MNIFDIGIILILVMCFIVGFKRGFIKEVVSLVGIIAVFIISYILMQPLGSFLCRILPFFNFGGTVEGISALNILLYQVIAFMIIFMLLLSVYAILIKLSGIIQKVVHMTIILWLPSKILGGVVAFITGYIVVLVLAIILMIPLGKYDIYNQSKVIDFMLNKTPVIANSTNKFSTSINEIYILGDKTVQGTITKQQANIRTIDMMLEHKIVSKKTINHLIESEKIDNSNELTIILNKYE